MTNQMNRIKTMTIAALLCAVGILIPMYFPKIIIGPASFTLASHVPIFIAMFISPTVAISVAIITTFGFFIAGFPLVIVLRALTHLLFAALGSYLLKKKGTLLNNVKTAFLYSFGISLLHALAEVVVVTFFFFGGKVSEAFLESGYVKSVLLMIGVGGLIHSMVDLSIAVFVWMPLQQVLSIPANLKIRRNYAK